MNYKIFDIPNGKVDVILDTDAYNEIDDQYAIAYMIKKSDKFNVKAICAAPFSNSKTPDVREGMIKSYNEIHNLLTLCGNDSLKEIIYKGSESYMTDENTPVDSDSSRLMADISDNYSPNNPLYIIAIGAITNVASAILMNPKMIHNCVVVWLGGHGIHYPLSASEFNMRQDIAAARVVMSSSIPLILLPCKGVVDRISTTKQELEHWLLGKNALCDYLYKHTVDEAESYALGKPWSRVIWDISAVIWFFNENEKCMKERIIPSPLPEYDRNYSFDMLNHNIKYIYDVNRDVIFEDLFNTLGE